MTCLEFRRRVGAEPFSADAEVASHRRDCPACTRHQDELRAMDGLIERALKLDPPPKRMNTGAGPQRRAYAIAAGLVAGIALGIVLLVVAPRVSIAREVIGHVLHEPGTMGLATPLAAADLAGVLDPDGVQLRPGAGEVTFAARCLFDGHVVPHLVVRTEAGPVTVLMLRHRNVAKPLRIDEQGYQGVVLGAPRGAIAVVGQGVADLETVAQKVVDAVDWGR
jgi:Protein of unknown function (DUF3379)